MSQKTHKGAKRGPKPRPSGHLPPVIRLGGGPEPTIPLDRAERAEFDRLIESLRRRGVAEKAEMAAVTQLAKLDVAIEAAFAAKPFDPRVAGVLIGHARGIRRELGLSLQSSRVHTRVWPEEGDAASYWRRKIGGGGES
jgi:hypothetical protein